MTVPMSFAVIGMPVGHSLSPKMHRAAFEALGLPHTYFKIETSVEELEGRLDALRRGDFSGFNVTVPHKRRVLDLVDTLDDSARAVGAANTLVRDRNGKLRAYNTDAAALEIELLQILQSRSSAANAFKARSGAILGTGGAARAAASALSSLGCRRIFVVGRGLEVDARARAVTREFEEILAATTPSIEWSGTPSVVAVPFERGVPQSRDLAVVVQATTSGMAGGPDGSIASNAVDWDAMPAGLIAYDVVYAPRETPFLQAARSRGLAAVGGLGMLVGQGALAFHLWLGILPPLDAMHRAIGSP